MGFSLLYFASVFISLMLPYILYPMPLLIPYSYLLLDNSGKILKLTLIFTFSVSLNSRRSFYKEHQKITKIIPTKFVKITVFGNNMWYLFFLIFNLCDNNNNNVDLGFIGPLTLEMGSSFQEHIFSIKVSYAYNWKPEFYKQRHK